MNKATTWAKDFVVALTGLATFGMANATFPEKPITLVVPFAAGGPVDKVARDLADALRKPLGGGVILVENRGGAGGTLGSAQVARANADGYMLLIHHIGMATAPGLYKGKLSYKTLDDFEYLGMFEEVPMTLVGRKGLPAQNFAELVSWIRSRKGEASMANAGIGSASHLCGLMFMSGAKLDMVTVPYKGTGPALNDVVGGQVDLMCDQTTNTVGQIAAETVRAYAVTTPERIKTKALYGTPTLQEMGFKGFDVSVWFGLYAPKDTAPALLKVLNEALRSASQDPAFVSKQEAMGARVITGPRLTPEGHKSFVTNEIGKWGAVIRDAGAYAE